MLTGTHPSSRNGATKPTTMVLLCKDLDGSSLGLHLDELSSWLQEYADCTVHIVESLCKQPKVLGNLIQAETPSRLVLGLCSIPSGRIELQAHIRKTGIDFLGVQMVNLGGSSNVECIPNSSIEWARTVLMAAVARAQAFPGSRPENLKAAILDPGQKISRRALFTLPPITYESVPTIDRSLCSAGDGCSLCVSACPYDALEKDVDKISVNRSACQSCGVCVTSCPQRAVEFPGWSVDEIEAQLDSFLRTDSSSESRPIAFVCKKTSNAIGPGWLPINVACASSVSVAAMLKALARGASSVGVFGCSEDCPTGLGEAIKGRIDYCREILGRLGGPEDSERVRLLNPSAENYLEPAPQHAPLPGERPADPVRLYGLGVAADALMELAECFGTDDLETDHSYSPTSLVQINPDTCTGCETCVGACPTGAISSSSRNDDIVLSFDARLCVGCSQCVTVCPERELGAIDVTPSTRLRNISQGPQALFRGQEVKCDQCGASVAPRQMLNRIAALLGDDYMPQLMEKLCVECRGASNFAGPL